MIQWNNLDTLASYKELFEVEKVNLAAAMTGEAAGVAAALTLENKCESRELDYKLVQNALRKLNIPLHFEDADLTPESML